MYGRVRCSAPLGYLSLVRVLRITTLGLVVSIVLGLSGGTGPFVLPGSEAADADGQGAESLSVRLERTLTYSYRGQSAQTSSLAWSPDGTYLAVGWSPEASPITLWDTRTWSVVRELASVGALMSLAFSPDGRLLFAGREVARRADLFTVAAWQVASGKLQWEIEGPLDPHNTSNEKTAWAVCASGDRLAVVFMDSPSSVHLYRQDTGRLVRALPGSGGFHFYFALACGHDPRSFVAAGLTGVIDILDAVVGRAVYSIRPGLGPTQALGLSPGDIYLASGHELEGLRHRARNPQSHRIVVWDSGGRRRVAEIVGHSDIVRALAFRGTGILVSGGLDGTVRLYEPSTGAALGPPLNHGHAVHALAVSPDGRYIASAGGAAVKIWEIRE